MRHPEIPGDALPSPGRKSEVGSGANVRRITAVMALALLSQCGHHESDPAHAERTQRAASAPGATEADQEILETKRRVLAASIRSCAEKCSASEAIALATTCGEKPLTAASLSAAAAKLDPSLRTSVHEIGEILAQYPELAPDILTILHEYLGQLPMTDPRRIAGMVIPCHDESLEQSVSIKITARQFLLLEEAAGAYAPRAHETLTAEAKTSILTTISESVESTR